MDAVTIDRLGVVGYRPRATDDGLLVTDGELRWRISKNERWLMLTTSPDVRRARGEYAPAGPSEEEAAPGFSLRSEGRHRLVLDRTGRERIRFVDVGDRAGDAIAYTHLADLPLSEVPGRLDSESAR